MSDDIIEGLKAIREKIKCGYFAVSICFGAVFAREDIVDSFRQEDMKLISYYECHNLAAGGPKFGCDFMESGHCSHFSEEIDENNLYNPEL